MRHRLIIAVAGLWLWSNVAVAADDSVQMTGGQLAAVVTSVTIGVGGTIVALLPKIRAALKPDDAIVRAPTFIDLKEAVESERRLAANEHARVRAALVDLERDFGVALLRTDGRVSEVAQKLEAVTREMAVVENRLARQERDLEGDRKRVEELKTTLHRLHVAVASAIDLENV